MVGSAGVAGSRDRDLTATGTPVIPGLTGGRIEDQLRWYDRKSVAAQRKYKGVKLLQLTVAAAVPVLAAAHADAAIMAALGGALLVLEGVQQIGQYHKLWIDYRSTWELLQREKFLFLARAGQYARAGNRERSFAEQIERVISRETTGWAADQQGELESENRSPDAA
jgi:hypothetical protein